MTWANIYIFNIQDLNRIRTHIMCMSYIICDVMLTEWVLVFPTRSLAKPKSMSL